MDDRPSQVQGPAGKLEAQPIAPIRVTRTIRPVGMTHPKPNLTVFDMGQNMVGWVRLRVKAGKPGTAVRLRFAETLQKDGMLYTANLALGQSRGRLHPPGRQR